MSVQENKTYDVLIVGGGNSAGYLAKGLRKDHGFKGSIGLISAEPTVPYERPALTKAFLHPPGAKVRVRLPGFHTCVGVGADRQTKDWYEAQEIDLYLSSRATKLDTQEKKVVVETGDGLELGLHYEKLVLSTGARALGPSDLEMPNAHLGNVFTIREEHEALRMVNQLEQGNIKQLVVAGGGYIGMETAAALSGWGFKTTLVFPENGLMERLFPSEIAQVFENHLKSRGIEIVKGEENLVTGLVPKNDNPNVVGGVRVKSGKSYPCDAVVFGLGSRLNKELFDDTGLLQGSEMGGLFVNNNFRTFDPSIFAIGDIAALHGGKRFEHVDFARKSAARAAETIAGKPVAEFSYLPYFYSRLFEYTDHPLVFQFYGDSDTSKDQKIVTFGKIQEAMNMDAKTTTLPEFGAIWLQPNSDKIQGIMICNAKDGNYDKAKQCAIEGTSFTPSLFS